jgi:hypothetical protein
VPHCRLGSAISHSRHPQPSDAVASHHPPLWRNEGRIRDRSAGVLPQLLLGAFAHRQHHPLAQLGVPHCRLGSAISHSRHPQPPVAVADHHLLLWRAKGRNLDRSADVLPPPPTGAFAHCQHHLLARSCVPHWRLGRHISPDRHTQPSLALVNLHLRR